jgi:hypothetical protein
LSIEQVDVLNPISNDRQLIMAEVYMQTYIMEQFGYAGILFMMVLENVFSPIPL